MPPSNFKRKWVKLWIDEWLTGTIREDSTPEERSIFTDFLVLSGRNRPPGYISANENTQLSVKRIASILNVPELLVKRCIQKFILSGRIEQDSRGIIKIVNWEQYQFTDYDRQKPFRATSRDERKEQPQMETPSKPDRPMGTDRAGNPVDNPDIRGGYDFSDAQEKKNHAMVDAAVARIRAAKAERQAAEAEAFKAKATAAKAVVEAKKNKKRR